MIQRFEAMGLLADLINEPVLRRLRTFTDEVNKCPDGSVEPEMIEKLEPFVTLCEKLLAAYPKESNDDV